MSIIFVALGGALGAWLRFTLGNVIARLVPFSSKFPLPILLINWLGSFLLGISPLSPGLGSMLMITGVLGGFTTFSTFSIETVTLIQQRRAFAAFTYVLLTVTGSILFYGYGILLLKKLI